MTKSCCPTAFAAASRSSRSTTPSFVRGSIITAIVVALGTSCRNSSSRFPALSPDSQLIPVTLPSGRLKLVTSPSLTGSDPVTNTIGTVVVAVLTAIEATPLATMTAAGLWISSAASDGRRSRCSFPQRYSMTTLRPTSYPLSLKPARTASGRFSKPSGRVLRRKPTTGIACCACAARGHVFAAAAPLRAPRNCRRCIFAPVRRGIVRLKRVL